MMRDAVLRRIVRIHAVGQPGAKLCNPNEEIRAEFISVGTFYLNSELFP